MFVPSYREAEVNDNDIQIVVVVCNRASSKRNGNSSDWKPLVGRLPLILKSHWLTDSISSAYLLMSLSSSPVTYLQKQGETPKVLVKIKIRKDNFWVCVTLWLFS